MEFKYYIFDVDGTLLNSYLVAYKAKEKVLKEYNIPYTKELIDLGFSSTSIKSSELFGIDVNSDIGKEIVKKEKIYFNEFSKDMELFPNAIETIKYLKSKQKNLGIVTSRIKSEVINEPKLKEILPYFDCIITASDVLKPKPDKESLEKLFDITKWNKNESIFIGDSNNDSKCAYSYGIKFGLAGWGAVNEVRYDYYFENFEQIKNWQ